MSPSRRPSGFNATVFIVAYVVLQIAIIVAMLKVFS